ncbi:MAG: hypothetical protein IPN68_01155 [Bacteroidetes bacterium]|nr:hypothetical protein [Bacteroidota bacterium]
MKSYFLIIPVIFLLLSCTSPKVDNSQALSAPVLQPVNGYSVPESMTKPPVIIQAGRPYEVLIKKKEGIRQGLNIYPVGNPQVMKMKAPVIKTPGKGDLKVPQIHPVTDIRVLCKAPEIVLAKDAYSKEINPQNFSSFSKLQGLRHDQVRGMVQDRTGKIWLATDDGLTAYDGKYFSHYTKDQGLTNNLILSVFIDKKENIWIGTFGGGVQKYDGKYLYTFNNSNGLISNVVNCIYEDTNGNMWFGTAGGVSVYDGINITNYSVNEGLSQNYIRRILQDNSGKIWISTNAAGVSVFDGISFSNYSEKEGLLQNNVNYLFKDKAGNIWLGTARHTLMKFNGSDFISFPGYKSSGSGADFIRTIIQDNNGNLWIGTEQGGLSLFNEKTFINYSDKDGLTSNMIRCSLLDMNGNLWFGTRGGGLIKYDGRLFTHLTKNEGLSNSRVMSVLEKEPGDIWLGTFGGYVTRITTTESKGLKQNYYSYYNDNDGLLNSRIYSILKDSKGNIWFGTDGGGASVFDGHSMKTYTEKQGLCSDTVRKIIEDREGNIWFATYGSGISKFDGKYFYNYSKEQGMSSNSILSLLEDSEGRIWMATGDAGLCMFKNGTFTHYGTGQGFINNTVYSILQDREGVLWFGTGGNGVVRFDGKNFTTLPELESPNSEHVLSLFQDSKSDIWLGTRFGPVVIKSASLKSSGIISGDIITRKYSYEDGFTGIGCNVGAITETKDGIIWIGTNDRLTKYHSEGELKVTAPLNIQITGIKLFNEDLSWTGLIGKEDTSIMLHNGMEVGNFRFKKTLKWSGLPEDLSLKYNNNYLTFNYIAVSVTGNSKIRYQYKLVGLEENWNMPTERTEVSFGNLSHGNYVFKVKTVDSDGLGNAETEYPFSIRPPWYKTIWFYVLTIFFILIVIFAYIQYRIRRLELDKHLLQTKVDEQTSEISRKNDELVILNSEKDKFFSIIAHDLRGPFSGLMMLTQEMIEGMQDLNKEEISEIIKVIQSSSTNLFRLLENLLNWARMKQGKMPFKPENLELSPIVGESLSLLMIQANAKKIEVVINISPGLFIYADRNMLQAVIRNLVSNAVKFTHPGGKITVNVLQVDNQTMISVIDDGIGMNHDLLLKLFHIDEKTNRSGTQGEISTGLGLLLCKEFIEKHNGQIWVESEEEKGSAFHFSIPMHTNS